RMSLSECRKLHRALGDGPRGLMLALKSRMREMRTPNRLEAAKISPPWRGVFTACPTRKKQKQDTERASGETWHRTGDELGDRARRRVRFEHPRDKPSARAVLHKSSALRAGCQALQRRQLQDIRCWDSVAGAHLG